MSTSIVQKSGIVVKLVTNAKGLVQPEIRMEVLFGDDPDEIKLQGDKVVDAAHELHIKLSELLGDKKV